MELDVDGWSYEDEQKGSFGRTDQLIEDIFLASSCCHGSRGLDSGVSIERWSKDFKASA